MRKTMLCLVLLATSVMAALGQNPVNRVIDEAMKPSQLETNLAHLTDQIGAGFQGRQP